MEQFDSTLFLVRQERLAENLQVGQGLVVASGLPKRRNHDVEYPFRPSSNYYYLTGLNEPHSFVLISRLSSGIHRLLVLFNPDNHQRQWSCQHQLTIEQTSAWQYDNVLSWQDCAAVSHFIKGLNLDIFFLEEEHLGDLDQFELFPVLSSSLKSRLELMRAVKDDVEIHAMKMAQSHSATVFNELLQQPFGSYLAENHIAAKWFHYATEQCLENAYGPIIAGGSRACTLHYQKNNKPLHALKDRAVLMDAGYEYQYYASDITRMIPLSHPPSWWQEIYQIVLDTQKKVIGHLLPGVSLSQLQELTQEFFLDDLQSGGFLPKLADKKQLRCCYMHSVGHHLGLDVHDCSSLSKDIPLVEGMCITVEPGLYFNHEMFADKPWFELGIRLEDNLIVSPKEAINITFVAKELSEILKNV